MQQLTKEMKIKDKEVIDRVNLAKLNKPISQLALKRWFTDNYLEKNPKFMKNS